MIFIDNTWSTSASFNLALEEYLFKQFNEDLVMLWRGESSIVVGKHQNTLAEINYPYVKEKGIEVVRRLSGGGAVYHDLGNLNFTYMMTGDKTKLVDFTKFISPIIEALASLGVTATQGKRNEILVDNRKISGNAEHTFKSRVLHHGTLLFDSDLSALIQSLRINPLKFTDKAIKSVQSRVVNLVDFLPSLSMDEFRAHLSTSLKNRFQIQENFELTEEMIAEVRQLEKEKYQTWDWNFGYSPNYVLHKWITVNGEEMDLKIEVKKGTIQEVGTTQKANLYLETLFEKMKGKRHQPELLAPFISPESGLSLMDLF